MCKQSSLFCQSISTLKIFFFNFDTRGLYYKNILTIVSYSCTINVSLALTLALASVINYDRK
jgi:hypothetical protein